MPCPLVGRTKLSHRIRYIFIWSLLRPMLPARTVNGATGVFYGPREHPNIFQGTGQHWFSREQGNKPNFGGSESCNLENSSFSMHWPYTFVIVRRQLQCFDALLIFKRMLMSKNWLKQDVRICTEFAVRFVYADTNNSVRSWWMGMLTIKIR